MTIIAKVIEDSISPDQVRLTTLQLRYPKFIHGEAKTHRVMRISDRAYEFLEEVGVMDDSAFSRNASSSRAIPVERLIQDILNDPAMPVYWGKNCPGMQAMEEMNEAEKALAIADHLADMHHAVASARRRSARGEHKQTVNRILEPWMHINVVVTATEWANFFALRCHPAAQPEMRALADAAWTAREASVPKLLKSGQWHLPYVSESDDGDGDVDLIVRYFMSLVKQGLLSEGAVDQLSDRALIKLSVARCARVSYLTHDQKAPNIPDDLALYDRLVDSEPLHASPAEHQATPDLYMRPFGGWAKPKLHGNFVGWVQYRKTLPNENVGDR